MERVKVIGAGLAGCEAAYQLSVRGIGVDLYEMKPEKKSPAHSSDCFSELVCSNSLRSNDLLNAVGLLKEEMRRLDSLIMRCADSHAVPAGGALAVDRKLFSESVTKEILGNKNIVVHYGEVEELEPSECTIVATGPLTSERLSGSLQKLLGEEYLYFFDAAAPIVTRESIDFSKAFCSDRYGKGEGDYVNCPMNPEEYLAFYHALVHAETAKLHGFEGEGTVFEGCMPVEVMAARGEDTLRFGPMKPVGLFDPATGKRPYAVVQLRKENAEASIFNLVGFQTHLTFSEQRRVFSMIPALSGAEFVRYGVMHRNTFLNSPRLLNCFYQLKKAENIFFAGQITGVEGYVESAASGLAAGINAARRFLKKEMTDFTGVTAMGALQHHVAFAATENFQPMNINFGIMEPCGEGGRDKRAKRQAIADRALAKIEEIKNFT